jgi:hypothetical protein
MYIGTDEWIPVSSSEINVCSRTKNQQISKVLPIPKWGKHNLVLLTRRTIIISDYYGENYVFVMTTWLSNHNTRKGNFNWII